MTRVKYDAPTGSPAGGESRCAQTAPDQISNLIREGKTFQIPSMMQVGRAQGMVALNDALMELVTKKLVEPEEAYLKAVDKAGFEGLLKRGNVDTGFVSTVQ